MLHASIGTIYEKSLGQPPGPRQPLVKTLLFLAAASSALALTSCGGPSPSGSEPAQSSVTMSVAPTVDKSATVSAIDAYTAALTAYQSSKAAAQKKLELNRAPILARSNFDIALGQLETGDDVGSDYVFSGDVYLIVVMKDEYNALIPLWKDAARLRPLAEAEETANNEQRLKNDPSYRDQVEADKKEMDRESAVAAIKQKIIIGSPITELESTNNPFLKLLKTLYPYPEATGDLPPDKIASIVYPWKDESAYRKIIKNAHAFTTTVCVFLPMQSMSGKIPLYWDQNNSCYAISSYSGGNSNGRTVDYLLHSMDTKDFGYGVFAFDFIQIGPHGGCSIDLSFDKSQTDQIGKIYMAAKDADAIAVEAHGTMIADDAMASSLAYFPDAGCEGTSMKLIRLIARKGGKTVQDFNLPDLDGNAP